MFDSHERFFPVGVEESLERTGARVPESFPRTPGHTYRKRVGIERIDFPADIQQPNLPPVGYHRAVNGGGLVWHQWWLWYVDNPWNRGGVGRHEGDWELAQIGCDPHNQTPLLVTLSQHRKGAARCAWDTHRDPTGRLLISVARDSHAMFFHPVSTSADVCDGKGRNLNNIEWRQFGPWKTWRGLWGNSTGVGRSPESPGRQHTRWTTPHLFHSSMLP